jgi:DNA-binding NtrC family response regulator
MSLVLQAKILRVLQDSVIRPVGGTDVVKVEVRIIAATNKKLQTEMEAGRFREDLYYRLNVIPIYIPPLRERPQDIPVLAEAFLAKYSGDRTRTISSDGMHALSARPWKGNARELENAIERALTLSDAAEVGPEDFSFDPTSNSQIDLSDPDFLHSASQRRLTLRELQSGYIDEIMRLTGGNKVRAAKMLGVDRKTLYRHNARRNHEDDQKQ